MFHLVIEQGFECSKAPTSDSVSSVFSWALLEELIAVLFLQEGREGGGGGLIPFPRKLFFQIPAQIPQSQPVLLKLKSHSHFSIVFFLS